MSILYTTTMTSTTTRKEFMPKDLKLEIEVKGGYRPKVDHELVAPGFVLATKEGFRTLGGLLNHLLRVAIEKGKE